MNKAIWILLFCLPVCLWSQQAPAGQPQEIPKSMSVNTSSSGLSDSQVGLFHELLLAHISESFWVDLIDRELPNKRNQEEQKTPPIDLRLEVQLTRRGNQVDMRTELFSENQKQALAVLEKSSPIAFADLDETFWSAVLSSLENHLRPNRQEIVFAEKIEKLDQQKRFVYARGTVVTISASPGTHLLGLSAKPLIVGESGRVSVEVPQKATYRIKAHHWRFDPDVQDIFVGTEPVQVKFDQRIPPRLALSVVADFDRTSGLGIMTYLLPGRLYTELRFDNSFIGIVPEFWHGDSVDWLARNLAGSLSFGYFILQSKSFGLALGLGGIVRFHSPPPSNSFRLNYLFPAGWIASLLLEARITDHWKGIIEWAPEFYLVRDIPSTIFDPGSVYEHMSQDEYNELMSRNVVYNDMGHLRIGVRYYF